MNSTVESLLEGPKSNPECPEWKKRLIVVLVCLGVTSFVVLPFFVMGVAPEAGCCRGAGPRTHDGVIHYNQMDSFWRGLRSGRIYPRWEDTMHAGYGTPTMIFYPPGLYYLSSLFYLALGDWHVVLIVLQWVLMAASGATVYWYARRSMSWGPATVAMAAYLVAPYHLIDQYQRGAIAEQLNFIWMPVALILAERLWLKETAHRLTALIGLAALIAVMLLSHPPTAYQFMLIFGLCAAGVALKGRDWQGLVNLVLIGVAGVLGTLIVASYLYPAIADQPLVNISEVERMWPYHASYALDFSQQMYDHVRDKFVVRLDLIWTFSLVVIVLAGAILLRWRAQLISLDLRARLWLWLGAGGLAIFFMTRYSYPVGRFIPKIEAGNFAWRMLAVTSLVIALIAGACWQAAGDLRRRHQRVASIICGLSAVAIVAAATQISVTEVARPMKHAEAFRPDPKHYHRAYVPKGVPFEVPEMAPASLASGGGQVSVALMHPEFRRYQVELDRADQLQLRTSNFPGWTAFVDGEKAEVKSGPVGNIVIELPPGKHEVTLDFRLTPFRRLCNWISIISIALLASVYVIARRRT